MTKSCAANERERERLEIFLKYLNSPQQTYRQTIQTACYDALAYHHVHFRVQMRHAYVMCAHLSNWVDSLLASAYISCEIFGSKDCIGFIESDYFVLTQIVDRHQCGKVFLMKGFRSTSELRAKVKHPIKQ